MLLCTYLSVLFISSIQLDTSVLCHCFSRTEESKGRWSQSQLGEGGATSWTSGQFSAGPHRDGAICTHTLGQRRASNEPNRLLPGMWAERSQADTWRTCKHLKASGPGVQPRNLL